MLIIIIEMISDLPQPCPRELIIPFFQQFGYMINSNFINKSKLILKYKDEETVLYLIRNKIYFGDKLLNIAQVQPTKANGELGLF